MWGLPRNQQCDFGPFSGGTFPRRTSTIVPRLCLPRSATSSLVMDSASGCPLPGSWCSTLFSSWESSVVSLSSLPPGCEGSWGSQWFSVVRVHGPLTLPPGKEVLFRVMAVPSTMVMCLVLLIVLLTMNYLCVCPTPDVSLYICIYIFLTGCDGCPSCALGTIRGFVYVLLSDYLCGICDDSLSGYVLL